jgi:hypothetical protein
VHFAPSAYSLIQALFLFDAGSYISTRCYYAFVREVVVVTFDVKKTDPAVVKSVLHVDSIIH